MKEKWGESHDIYVTFDRFLPLNSKRHVTISDEVLEINPAFVCFGSPELNCRYAKGWGPDQRRAEPILID